MTARIAIVDNHKDTLTMLCALMEDEGYFTLPLLAHEDVLGILHACRPDVILHDPHCGGTAGGWQLLPQLRQDPVLAAVPLIVCSADSAALMARRDELEHFGCQVVPKPFSIDDILRAVQSALSLGWALPAL